MTIIKNAKVESVFIGFENHNILTLFLNLKYGEGSGQGFGGYFLDTRHGANMAIFIRRVLEIVGADEVNQLPGKVLRVRSTNDFGPIEAIGHALEERWFVPKDELE